MITIEQAKALHHGDIIIQTMIPTSNHWPSNKTMVKAEKPIRWRINGKIKLWKREPERFSLPVKYGLYDYGYLTNENAQYFEVEQ